MLLGTNNLACCLSSIFFFNDPATTEIYTLSLHDALPICNSQHIAQLATVAEMLLDTTREQTRSIERLERSEEHTSELQSHVNLVCRLLLEKKKSSTDLSQLVAIVLDASFILFVQPSTHTL